MGVFEQDFLPFRADPVCEGGLLSKNGIPDERPDPRFPRVPVADPFIPGRSSHRTILFSTDYSTYEIFE